MFGNFLPTDIEKANILCEHFQRVFTEEDLSNIPHLGESNIQAMGKINISSNGILKLLKKLNVEKACGPDLIPIRVMKCAAEEIVPILEVIIIHSLNSGILRKDWLTANITPIFKKGKNSDGNYRPVSLTAVCSKILKHIICSVVGTLCRNASLLSLCVCM